VNVVLPSWTTRNSSEYTTPTNVTMPTPTASSASIAGSLATVNPIGICGTARPSPTAAST
jgi:hypothetical protein